MKFRYDINALRAIAIIAVVGFHYNVTGFSGGFCGVDIFFVISGYLMSQIIIDGINANKFSLLEFYGKRLKRIAPALLFMVFVVLLIDFFVYFPGDYRINEGVSPGRYFNIYNSTGSSQISAGLVPYMFDEDHFTSYGSELIADKILSDSTTINFITKSSK